MLFVQQQSVENLICSTRTLRREARWYEKEPQLLQGSPISEDPARDGNHASFCSAQVHDPWPNRRRCDQSPQVFAGPQSEHWGVSVVHGVHYHLLGTSSR